VGVGKRYERKGFRKEEARRQWVDDVGKYTRKGIGRSAGMEFDKHDGE
jgi:hypothetical protein